jgi:hypothetical protein
MSRRWLKCLHLSATILTVWALGISAQTIPAAPLLAAPTSGAGNQPLALTLNWNTSAGAFSYGVQVSLSSTFGTTIFSQSGATLTSTVVNGLANATTYYWRANAADTTGDTSWSGAWSFTTIVAPPASPALVAPSSGATGEPLAVGLAWDSVGGAASYEAEVSLSSTFGTTIFDQTGQTLTAATVTGLSNGTVYYWRVNASNAGGTSWSTAESFTTIVAAPAAPTPASPASESVNQPLSVALSWGSMPAAASYGVEVSTDVNFGSTVFGQSGITGTSTTSNGLSNNVTYYWRVDASNAGGTGAWSNIWIFTTIVAAPAAPPLASPISGSANQPLVLGLSWGSSAGASSYEVEVSLSSAFGTTFFDQSGAALTSATVSGLSNSTVYYWRANASNIGGKSWSNAANFTTVMAAPAAPVLASPTNGAINQPIVLGLTWGSVASASSYEVEVSLTSTFAATIFDQAGGLLTSATVIGLANGTTCYWRVNASNIGGTGAWATAASFTTIAAAPAAPLLASPSSGVVGQLLSPVLSWGSVAGAVSYGVQVSTDVNFGSTVFGQSGLAATATTAAGLANNVSYYWRAEAVNAGGAGWSNVWIFTTIAAIPAAPSLASPSNASGSQPLSPVLSWGSVARASSYEVEVSSTNTFTATLFDQAGAAMTSAILTGLANGTTYYWRANASNAGGTSWSNLWSFTTIVAPPTAPALVLPTNGAGSQSPSLSLTWGSSAGTATYGVQVSTDVNFGSTLFGQNGIVALSAKPSGLSNGTTYYWRASASNAGGSTWSEVWSFATVPLAPSAPVLSTPSNGTTGVASALILSWTTVSGSQSYTAQVSTGSAFATTLFGQTGGIPVAAVSGLAYGVTYYWRAGATNSDGTGWSAAWSFVTLTAPAAPSLVSPSNGALFANGMPVTVSWATAATATSYSILSSPDSTFAVITLFQSGLTAASCQFTPVTGVPNYWRVAATNDAGTTWSGTWSIIPSTAVRPVALPGEGYAFSMDRGAISYTLPRAEQVEIALYDVLGRTAMTLSRRQAAGSYRIDLKAGTLASGQYIARFKAGIFEKQAVIMLTR